MGRVLVTGATGFLGSAMVDELNQNGAEVTGTYFNEPPKPTRHGLSSTKLERLDVRDHSQVMKLFERVRPDEVYHFAGQAYVIPSWEDPLGTFDVNLTGTLHVLEAIRRVRPRCAFGFAGSGTEYGDAVQVPTPESAPLLPTSPYASSKVAADVLCYQYFRSFEIPVRRFRIFGTTGVGKRGDVCNDFASQVAFAERSPVPIPVLVGDLTRRRDILDVHDCILAMIIILRRGNPGDAFNIGSGRAPPIQQVLDSLIGMAETPLKVIQDPSRRRLVDEPVHLGDTTLLRSLGWEPRVPMSETLTNILHSWREEARRSTPTTLDSRVPQS
jgi:GDP-4-dehydro-6-deoxy-D-mannose reductase